MIFEQRIHTAILPDFILLLLGVHRNPKRKEFLKSSMGFLRAVQTGHGHPGPV
jgi:hypothetical protein